MEISFFRSSSLNNWSYCEQQYFLTYVLGLTSIANQKTDMGTITHKVLEILAMMKQAEQNGLSYIEDDILGRYEFDKTWNAPQTMSPEQISEDNKARSAKSIYKYDCFVTANHIRYGVPVVEHITKVVYDYYVAKLPHHKWMPANFKQCRQMVWIALDFKNGMFDPRKRNILSPERKFEFTIKEDWAILANGEYLKVKGTVDLLTTIDENTIEIIDWKTGQRLDWAAKGTPIKDYKRLCKDTQLMLYYYAVKEMYPDKDVILSIFFIRDGGPFSVCFDEDNIVQIKEKIKKTLKEIQNSKQPRMVSPTQKDFRCDKLCHFFKTNWPGTNTNVCKYINEKIKKDGIDKVSEECRNGNFNVDNYQAPGE